jgi:hypothetical protein
MTPEQAIFKALNTPPMSKKKAVEKIQENRDESDKGH